MIKFHPIVAGLILIGLLLGLHQYQVSHNPCYGVLRLHVIANSDYLSDQAVKMKVRDEVISLMNSKFASVSDEAEARRIAGDNLEEIEKTAAKTLAASGYDYPVHATLGPYNFPTRFYGKEIFPAGEYTAVRVVLGEGQGQNWWCVLFPPLCLEDLEKGKSMYSQGAELRFKFLDVIKGQSLAQKS